MPEKGFTHAREGGFYASTHETTKKRLEPDEEVNRYSLRHSIDPFTLQ